jgi:hypothetical protein
MHRVLIKRKQLYPAEHSFETIRLELKLWSEKYFL